MNGCIDVTISWRPDSRGLYTWSIHLYKQFEDPILQASDAGRTRTIFTCTGHPHNYVVTVVTVQDFVFYPPDYLECIRVTQGMVDADFENAMEALVEVVVVDNTLWTFNGQQWVLDALDVFHDMELFPDADYLEARTALVSCYQGYLINAPRPN